jgi:hypothetical protein
MKLYLIEIPDPYHYDIFESFIVRAENESQVREMAIKSALSAQMVVDENAEDVVKFRTSPVTEVHIEGDAGIVHASYRAG